MSNKTEQVHIRVLPQTKRRFWKRCIDSGVSMTTVLDIFMIEFGFGHLTYDERHERPIRYQEDQGNDATQ